MTDPDEVIGYIFDQETMQELISVKDRLYNGNDRDRRYGNELQVLILKASPILMGQARKCIALLKAERT